MGIDLRSLAERLSGVAAKIELQVGEDLWWIDTVNAEIHDGRCPSPDVVVSADARTLERVLAKELSIQDALVQGRLSASGDLGLIALLEERL